MSGNFLNVKKKIQSKLSELRVRRKTAVKVFKEKAEAKKIEQIRDSILK